MAGMISTSFICGTGLKKWMPTTRDDETPLSPGWPAAAAMRVRLIDDVLEPRIAGAGRCAPRREKRPSLSAGISGMAWVSARVQDVGRGNWGGRSWRDKDTDTQGRRENTSQPAFIQN